MSDKDPKPDSSLQEFLDAVPGARPLSSDKVEPFRPPVAPVARFRLADEQAVLNEAMDADYDSLEQNSGTRLRYRSERISPGVLRALGRGKYRIEAEFDLHGLTLAEAKTAVNEFLLHCCQRGHRCVRLVHGKGLGSGQRGPVLKNMLNSRLRKFNAVLGYISAPARDGGTGAVYVLLDA